MVPARGSDGPSRTDDLDALFAEPHAPSRQERKARSRARASAWSRPVRRWRTADERDDELEPEKGGGEEEERHVYWRARDSLWFEPLVALAIIVVLLVSMFAYTSNWPPVYVVESNSMQHGGGDHLGVLNAGDVVLAQRQSQGQIATYFPSVSNGGPSNYGEPGDVILYYPNGATSSTPIVHRALLFLQWNGNLRAYNATTLVGVPCSGSSHPYYQTPGTSNGCGTTNLTSSLELYHLGWQHDVTVTISFGNCLGDLGAHSGFLTLGDNNSFADQVPGAVCTGTEISQLVAPSWVIGAARGLLPWFGALKLFLDGNSQLVPGASWAYMGLSLAGIVVAAAAVHFVLRRLGVRSETRRREEARSERNRIRSERAERAEEDEAEEAVSRPVRSWKQPDLDGVREPPPAPKLTYDDRRRTHVTRRSRPPRPHRAPAAEAEDEPDADAE